MRENGQRWPAPRSRPPSRAGLVERRRSMVARLAARQLTIREIVAALDRAGERNPGTGRPWSRRAVHSDLRYLHRLWCETHSQEIIEHAARVLAHLAEIQRVAWARGRIDIAVRAVQQECKILQLDKPIMVDITERLKAAAVEAGLDPDEVVEEAQRILKNTRDT